jgi:predicted dinucleotide-binding enzyme
VKAWPGEGGTGLSRREFLRRAGGATAALAITPMILEGSLHGMAAWPQPTRIGIIGAGRIGGAVGLQWAAAGYEVLFSSRNPDELAPLVEQGGALTRAGLPDEAASFGEVVLVAVPFDALPQVSGDYSQLMQGKVVIGCSNPSRNNPSPLAEDALSRGSGVVSQELFPGTRLVRAFNAINYRSVTSEGHRAGELVGIPIAGDDADAVRVTSALVVDAGFDPVVVGGLDRAGEFDPGSPVFVTNMTAAEIRETLGLG